MMNKVKIPEQPAVVHEPVRPVKIGVVNEEHERKRKPEIQKAMLADVCIKSCIGLGIGKEQQGMRSRKHKHRHERAAYLPQIIAVLWKLPLNLFISHLTAQPFIPYQPANAGHQRIRRDNQEEKINVRPDIIHKMKLKEKMRFCFTKLSSTITADNPPNRVNFYLWVTRITFLFNVSSGCCETDV